MLDACGMGGVWSTLGGRARPSMRSLAVRRAIAPGRMRSVNALRIIALRSAQKVSAKVATNVGSPIRARCGSAGMSSAPPCLATANGTRSPNSACPRRGRPAEMRRRGVLVRIYGPIARGMQTMSFAAQEVETTALSVVALRVLRVKTLEAPLRGSPSVNGMGAPALRSPDMDFARMRPGWR